MRIPTETGAELNRRDFLRASGLLLAAAGAPAFLRGEETMTEPFGNGEREIVAYPEKRPLIRLTARPPQLETPFEVFNEGLITPNDAFFVRYHEAGIPTSVDASKHRIRIAGQVDHPLELSLDELKQVAEPVELVAVNQCSGNSRGFFQPRVAGGQSGNGAMGCARWTGVPLKAVLDKAGVRAAARQITFQGLDHPVLPTTPQFLKALEVDHARDGEVMIAWAMNGADIPMLNGYPVKLVVPGYYGTYWVKHLADIEVLDHDCTSFWMTTAYRVPDNPTHSVPPGQPAAKTVPIGRFDVRSFITSLKDGDRIRGGDRLRVRGIAFDGGSGIRKVEFSPDGGRSWQEAQLGRDLGRYAFREWAVNFRPSEAGRLALKCRATSNAGETQPAEPRWNPAGYMRNVIETVKVEVAA
jgi:sulfite dehydrogenase